MQGTPQQQPDEPSLPILPTSSVLVQGRTGIPQLAFGLYKVPPDQSGVMIILDAIEAGYRHFDCATIYSNEEALGKAVRASGIPRTEFYLASKVWNDVQRQGRASVRKSVEESLQRLSGDTSNEDKHENAYWDLFYIHWPVPNAFVDTYKELQLLVKEAKIRNIGLSNFSIQDHQLLLAAHLDIPAIVNQIEVSPYMYRKETIQYFQQQNMHVAASKALHRGQGWTAHQIMLPTTKYGKTAAQIFLRWGLQKNLIVLAKTSNTARMIENRDVLDFEIDEEDMSVLDGFTSQQNIEERELLEKQRKES